MTDLTKSKSPRTQLLLTLLFGPLGLFYSSFAAATLLLLAAVVLAKDFGWPGVFFVWLAAIATGFLTVHRWNRRSGEYGHSTSPRASSDRTTA